MSESEQERIEEGNGGRPRWSIRLDRLISSLSALLTTRSEIAGVELSEKAWFWGGGIAGGVIGAIRGFLAFFVAGGLVAAVFARIWGWAGGGVLAPLILSAAGAAAAAAWSVRQLGRVKP